MGVGGVRWRYGQDAINQSSSCPARVCWGRGEGADQPKVERAPSWLPGRAQKVAETSKPSCPRPGGRWAVGCWGLLPGGATWPGYAQSCTYWAMYGVRSNTAQNIDTRSSRQRCRRWGQDGRGGGEDALARPHAKLPGSNEHMSFRLKAAGEQELKICNRNGGLSGGGWGGRRPGGLRADGAGGAGRGKAA